MKKNRKIEKRNAQLHDSFSWSNVIHRSNIILSYANWIQEFINVGWNAYLFTFMFNQIPGSIDAKVKQM
jgi:hypothetical protein